MLLFSSINYSQESKAIALLDYMNTIEKNSTVSFSYDVQLLQKISVVPIENQDIKAVLHYLEKETAFNFKSLDNGTVLVSPRIANKNFKLCINIIDAESNLPLTGATISNGSKENTFSYEDESFIKYVNYTNWKTIHIKYLGYQEQIISIDALNGQPCKTIYLSPAEIVLNDVVINYLTSGIRYNNDNQSIEVKVKNAGLLPGETETDIFTSIEAIPGVNSSNGKAGNLVIRGDDPDKTLIHFDNIPIYHNGHYFGAFSPYNADLLKTISINRNGYAAKNGGGISGLIQMNTTKKVADSANYSAGLATSFYLMSANIPIVKDKWSIQVGTRASYPFNNFNTPKINAIEDFIFQQSLISQTERDDNRVLDVFDFDFSDINFKSNFKINTKNTLNFSSLYVTNTLDLSVRQLNPTGGNRPQGPTLPANTKDNTFINLKNIGFNLEHTVTWNKNLSTTSFVTLSEFKQDFYNEIAPPDEVFASRSYINIIKNFSLKSTTTKSYANKNTLDFGLEAINYDVSGDRSLINPFNPEFENVDTHSKLVSLYSDFTFKKNEPLTLKLGLRSSYYSLTKNSVYLEPRLLMNYNIGSSLTLKMSAGMYNQYLNNVSGRNGIATGVEQYNWKLSNGNNLPVVNGKQVMFGGIYQKNKWLIDVEIYSKKTDDIAIYDIYNYSNTDDFFIGNYTTVGADILIRKSWNNIDAWVSYSNIKTLAEFKDIQEERFRSVWDQNHQLNMVFSYNYKKFRFSTGWKYKSGLASIEDIRYFYLNGSPFNGIDLLNRDYSNAGDPQYDEFPSQHQLDASISYTYSPKTEDWNTVIGLSATNIYNRQNITGQDRSRSGNRAYRLNNKYGIGFAPSLLVKFNF